MKYDLDFSIAPRRFVLIDLESGRVGDDKEMTIEEAESMNWLRLNKGLPGKWYELAPMSKAA